MTELLLPPAEREVHFDRLPVWVLRCSPTVPPRLRIYAQGQLGQSEEAVLARIWTFEVAPAESTRLVAVFCAGGHVLEASASPAGETVCRADGKEVAISPAQTFSGEDLQGVYHGVVLQIPKAVLSSALAADLTKPGTTAFGVNLLRIGESISSLVPQGEFLPLQIERSL